MHQLGHFFSSASGKPDKPGYSELFFQDEKVFNDYLIFKSLDQLLEERFNSEHEARKFVPSDSLYAATPVIKSEIRKGTALIIMAIDPDKPELDPKQASFFRLQDNGLGNFVWTQLSSSSRLAG